MIAEPNEKTELWKTEPWTHKRIRHRLSTLIDVLPTVVGGDEQSRTLLKTIADDLHEIRAGLDQMQGDYK